MKDDPTRCSVFSFRWFVVSFSLHLILTAILGGLAFVTAMGSFTHDVGSAMTVWKAVLWVWTPLAVSYGGSTLYAIIWSLLIGIAVGFIARRHRKEHGPKENKVPNKSR